MRLAFPLALFLVGSAASAARTDDPPRPSLEEEFTALQGSDWRQSKDRDAKQAYVESIRVTFTASGERRYMGVEVRAQDVLTGKETTLNDYGMVEIDLQEIKGERFFRYGKSGSIHYRLDGDKLTLDGKFPGMLVPDLLLSGTWEKVVPPPPKRKR